jgi:hypothetical protein
VIYVSIKAESNDAIKRAFPPEGIFVECPETGKLVFVEVEQNKEK